MPTINRPALAMCGIALFSLSFLGRGVGPAVAAQPPQRALHTDAKTPDYSAHFDANSLLMFVTNRGSFAFDVTGLLSNEGGLHYPGNSDKTAIFAGGLWVAAKLGKGVRASTAEYAFDYVPGPMQQSTYVPDQPRFHVYKINRGDTRASNPDYRDWPFDDGAPAARDFWGNDSLDAEGRPLPLLLGDQTLWAVCNDANQYARDADPGSPLPLGIEVQTLVWGHNIPGSLDRTIFLRFTIINKGDSIFRDPYVSLWCDADLGSAGDDLVGCDTSLSLGYCYNSGPDAIYGSAPPAVGYVLLEGPRGGTVDQARPMTAFSGFANGDDPNFALAGYYYMHGLSVDGEVVINPVTGLPTAYMLSGDPVAGSGWLDDNPSDRRFMVNSGPFTMAPGDTQVVALAVLVGQGNDRLESVASLREAAIRARQVYDSLLHPPVIVAIDIRPQQCPNTLADFMIRDIDRPRATGVVPGGDLPVALLGTASFDVSTVDPATVRMAGVAPVSWDYEDLAAPLEWRESPCDCAATGKDGVIDLVCRFRGADVVAAVQPTVDHQTQALVVTGRFRDGHPLAGRDCITFLLSIGPGAVVPRPRGTHQLIRANPNPFNAAVTLTYSIEQPGNVRLDVYDVLGRRITTLIDRRQDAGSHEVTWMGDDQQGRPVASGLYIARLATKATVSTEKLLLMK
ncbi:MAG: FlgD immunoglobulin-like domain containing protein [Candidatus Zixiibacteriota bacterium]